MGTEDAADLSARRIQGEAARAATLRRARDYVYNDPVPVVIDGWEVTFREIPYHRAMNYYLRFIAAASETSRQNFAALIAKPDVTQEEILAAIDPGRLVRDFGDLSLKLIADATGTTPEELEELPTSTLIEFAHHVVGAHDRLIERFLARRGELDALLARIRPPEVSGTNGHSSRPESSPPSSTPDSATSPSAR